MTECQPRSGTKAVAGGPKGPPYAIAAQGHVAEGVGQKSPQGAGRGYGVSAGREEEDRGALALPPSPHCTLIVVIDCIIPFCK